MQLETVSAGMAYAQVFSQKIYAYNGLRGYLNTPMTACVWEVYKPRETIWHEHAVALWPGGGGEEFFSRLPESGWQADIGRPTLPPERGSVTRSNLRITSVTIGLTRVWPAKRAGHTPVRSNLSD